MKSLNDRIWCGDFEIVTENERPYFNFLKNISSIADNIVLIDSINESWVRENDKEINIRLSYEAQEQTHVIWTKRRGDFLNMDVLFLLNKQLNLVERKFECSHQEESVYFINNYEKIKLEEKGVIFKQTDSLLQFDFVFYNVIMNLETEENDFTYEMIAELACNIEGYHNSNWQKNEFKLFQDTIKSRLLAKMNWQKVTRKGINTEKLYEFANKIIA